MRGGGGGGGTLITSGVLFRYREGFIPATISYVQRNVDDSQFGTDVRSDTLDSAVMSP